MSENNEQCAGTGYVGLWSVVVGLWVVAPQHTQPINNWSPVP